MDYRSANPEVQITLNYLARAQRRWEGLSREREEDENLFEDGGCYDMCECGAPFRDHAHGVRSGCDGFMPC